MCTLKVSNCPHERSIALVSKSNSLSVWVDRSVWLQVTNIIPKLSEIYVTDGDNLVMNVASRDSQDLETIVTLLNLPVSSSSS